MKIGDFLKVKRQKDGITFENEVKTAIQKGKVTMPQANTQPKKATTVGTFPAQRKTRRLH